MSTIYGYIDVIVVFIGENCSCGSLY